MSAYRNPLDVITPGKWDTIALIGMAPSGYEQMTHIGPDVGIFGLGVAHTLPFVPREFDVCLEIHPTWLLRHRNYSPDLWRWLRRDHPFPIFTHRHYKSIPASVPYPLDVVTARWLYPVVRGPNNEQVQYYTSSLDYLIALALLYEPRRIEVYGFDMATDTEYRFQREGAAFWMGMTAGLGVELWLPEDAPMLNSRLYAYGGSQWVKFTRLTDLMEQMADGMERARGLNDQLVAAASDIADGNPTPEDLAHYARMGEVQDVYHIFSGAHQAIEQLRETFAVRDILTRQEIEHVRSDVLARKVHHISRLNWFEGHVNSLKLKLREAGQSGDDAAAERVMAELSAAMEKQHQARKNFFVHNGAVQLLNHLIAECDLQADHTFRPVMDVVSIDVHSGSSTEAIRKPDDVTV